MKSVNIYAIAVNVITFCNHVKFRWSAYMNLYIHTRRGRFWTCYVRDWNPDYEEFLYDLHIDSLIIKEMSLREWEYLSFKNLQFFLQFYIICDKLDKIRNVCRFVIRVLQFNIIGDTLLMKIWLFAVVVSVFCTYINKRGRIALNVS